MCKAASIVRLRPRRAGHNSLAAEPEVGTLRPMEALTNDLKYGLAVLRRERGFTAAAVLALALGIGATTAVFSVIYGVLLRPLPYPEPERLVRDLRGTPGRAEAAGRARSEQHHPQRVAGAAAGSRGRSRRIRARIHGDVSRRPRPSAWRPGRAVDLHACCGRRRRPGRFFRDGEDAPRANLFVVISDRLWRERLGSAAGCGRPHADASRASLISSSGSRSRTFISRTRSRSSGRLTTIRRGSTRRSRAACGCRWRSDG